MKLYHVPATVRTAEVSLNPDTGTIKFSGISIPEDSEAFFRPVYDWLAAYNATNPSNKIVATFSMTYFNTSSVRHIMLICQYLIQNFSANLEIVWEYEEDDDDILHRGEEISRIMKFPLTFKAID